MVRGEAGGELRGADSEFAIVDLQLSEMEKAVMRCYSYGLSREEIAEELGITSEEVDRLTASAYRRLHQLGCRQREA